MLETSETAPPAARRDRSLAARRAARQAKESRESRIVESLNRGVSLADIAGRERVGAKRMRVIVDEILARRMPKPPAEFVATQVSRLEAALGVAYEAMAVDNLRAVALVVKIVRELDRYHGSAAAERWGLPEASRRETREELREKDKLAMALLVDRIRQTVLQEIKSERRNAMAPDSRDMAIGAAGRAPDPVEAPPTGAQMAPQSLEKIDSAPENGMDSGLPSHKIWPARPHRPSTRPAERPIRSRRRRRARKWRRKALKRLILRPETAWARQPRPARCRRFRVGSRPGRPNRRRGRRAADQPGNTAALVRKPHGPVETQACGAVCCDPTAENRSGVGPVSMRMTRNGVGYG